MPLGVRLDISYDRLRGRTTFRSNGSTTALVTAGPGGTNYATGSPASGTTAPGYTAPTATTGATSTGTSSGYNGYAIATGTDATLASAMLDAKLRLPLLGSHSSTSIYVVGGGGLHYFLNYDKSLALTNPAAEQQKFAALHAATTAAVQSGLPYSAANYSSSAYTAITRPGANAGVGMQWGLRGADLFVEGRYVTIFTKDRSTNYWPVILGVTLR